jgi:hypothetical protein
MIYISYSYVVYYKLSYMLLYTWERLWCADACVQTSPDGTPDNGCEDMEVDEPLAESSPVFVKQVRVSLSLVFIVLS